MLRKMMFFAVVWAGGMYAAPEGAGPLPPGSTLILGFTGGLDRADDPERGVRRLALAMRAMGLPGVYAETFEHYRHREARRRVVAALDANGNRRVDGEERGRVKIILYGQSLGGGEVVRLARELGKNGVAVELTVQVDSVSLGRDGRIPPNVRRAVNFYQKERLTFRGEDYIQAEDGQRTEILGNFRFRYPLLGLNPAPELSWRRVLGGGHARMEADPLLWAQIQALIVESIR
ncbi:MAG: hypothetical protein INH43_04065 [Acidobacteriaceae bacterium]|nr:hypothetical protein [Acidobacteriaceae bacterium]